MWRRLSLLLLAPLCDAYDISLSKLQSPPKPLTMLTGRRGFLATATAVLVPVAVRADDMATPDTTAINRQILSTGINPFNSACMGFGCADANNLDFNGAAAPPAGVDSISYPDFLKALDNKEVTLVELLPPNGDQAFATLKGKEEPIFIGEGWPVERSDGWSSPLYVVRILDNQGVPHRFRFAKPTFKGSQSLATTPEAPQKTRLSKDFIPNSYQIDSPGSFAKTKWR